MRLISLRQGAWPKVTSDSDNKNEICLFLFLLILIQSTKLEQHRQHGSSGSLGRGRKPFYFFVHLCVVSYVMYTYLFINLKEVVGERD